MAKIVIKSLGNKVEGFLNDENNPLSLKSLNFLFNSIEKSKIDDGIIKEKDIVIFINGNEIYFENFAEFLNNSKYSSFCDKLKSFIEEKSKEEVERIKKETKKPRINRKKSIKMKLAVTGILVFGVAAIYLGNKVFNSFDHSTIKSSLTEIVESPETTEIPVIIDYSSFNTKFYDKEEFNNIIINYATSQGISSEKLNWLLYNNNSYDEARLERYKLLVDYMAYFISNGYIVEVTNPINNRVASIIAHDYSRFVIIPENIEKMDSIVQLNPSGTSGYYCYPHVISDVQNGNTPNSIIVCSANSALDFVDYNNDNQLEKIIEFSLNHNINIKNIGILGYNNSGETAFINAGRILKDYPNMKIRIANIDGYYVTDFINKVNNILEYKYADYADEIIALLNGSVELLNIMPSKECYGISDVRLTEVLNESKYLESVLNPVYRLYSKALDSKDFPIEAYQFGIIDYLAGKLEQRDLEKNYNTLSLDENVYLNNNHVSPSFSASYQGEQSYQVPETDYSTLLQDYSWLFSDQNTETIEPTSELENGDNSWESYFNENTELDNTLDNEPTQNIPTENETWVEENNIPTQNIPTDNETWVEENNNQTQYIPTENETWVEENNNPVIEITVDNPNYDYFRSNDFSYEDFNIDDHSQNNLESGPKIHF